MFFVVEGEQVWTLFEDICAWDFCLGNEIITFAWLPMNLEEKVFDLWVLIITSRNMSDYPHRYIKAKCGLFRQK